MDFCAPIEHIMLIIALYAKYLYYTSSNRLIENVMPNFAKIIREHSSFAEIIHERKLNKESPFAEIAQAAIIAYYLRPYPKKAASNMAVNRPQHGGVHVSRTALNVEMLFQLYKKYKPELLKHPISKADLTSKDLELLKLAAIYHDSANTSEIAGDEKAHADQFRRDMVLLGWKADEIEPFAMAIQEKDGKNGKKKPRDAKPDDRTILQKLLGDADCLDIIRVMSDQFDKNYLAIIKELTDIPEFQEEIENIIKNYFETIAFFAENPSNGIGQLHIQCELSENCYLSVLRAQEDLLKKHIIFSCLKSGKIISLSDIDLTELSFLDLYQRINSKKVKNIIEKLLASQKYSVEQKEKKLSLDFKNGYLIRGLKISEINNELETLKTNIAALKKVGIKNPEELKTYIESQIKPGNLEKQKVFTPKGFKWRPCSFYQPRIPIQFFDSELAVIIDPSSKQGTQLCYFYKQNAMSAFAASGLFIYNQSKGKLKNKATLKNFQKKLQEQEQRRIGILPDIGHHYFGRRFLEWSEILGTYEERGIVGIIVPENEYSAKEALFFRAILGAPNVPFYRYTHEKGLCLLSEDTILTEAGLLKQPLSKHDELIKCINENISGTFNVSKTTIYHKTFHEIAPMYFKDDSSGTIQLAKRTLCYRKNPEDKNSIPIEKAMAGLKKLSPIIPGGDPTIVSVDVTKTINGISVTIETFYENKKEIQKTAECIIDVLNKIKQATENTIDFQNDEFFAFDVNHIDNIKSIPCFSDDFLKEKRMGYEFNNLMYPELKYAAFVNSNGTPIIRMLKDAKNIDRPTTLLPDIAKRYAERQISELNSHLQNEKIKPLLETMHIKKINPRIVYCPKTYIDWDIQVTDEKNKNIVKSTMIERLVPLFKKISNKKEDESIPQDMIFLITPYIQHDDLLALITKSLEISLSKSMNLSLKTESSNMPLR